tara:strand:+ start:7711 stop:7908 length:198 start_codon:yes stop_codon:yes gene_type:complete
MKRSQLILQGVLQVPYSAGGTGVLDSAERVRQARAELYDAVREDFELLNRAKMKSWVDAHGVVLD